MNEDSVVQVKLSKPKSTKWFDYIDLSSIDKDIFLLMCFDYHAVFIFYIEKCYNEQGLRDFSPRAQIRKVSFQDYPGLIHLQLNQ